VQPEIEIKEYSSSKNYSSTRDSPIHGKETL